MVRNRHHDEKRYVVRCAVVEQHAEEQAVFERVGQRKQDGERVLVVVRGAPRVPAGARAEADRERERDERKMAADEDEVRYSGVDVLWRRAERAKRWHSRRPVGGRRLRPYVGVRD